MLQIQVIGLGCPRCADLAQRTEAAAQRLGKPYRLEKVRDLQRVVEIGVPVPALVVNGVVVVAGRVPTVAAIQEILSQVAQDAMASHADGTLLAR